MVRKFPEKLKNRATIGPCNPTPGHTSRGKHATKGYMPSRVHCSAVHTVKTRKQPLPLTEEWIKKVYDIPYMWNLNRNYANALTYKRERDSQT